MKKKTTATVLPLLRTVGAVLAAFAFGATSALAGPIIQNVVETGGDNEATDTITAKWTGVTWDTTVANEPILNTPVGTPYTVPPFDRYVPCYVDRNHRYSEASATVPVPPYLIGGDYIMSGNDNRDNNPYQLDVTVSEPAVVFMLVDNRLYDGAAGDPPNFAEGLDPSTWYSAMYWMNTEGYHPFITGLNRAGDPTWPDEVGVDESSDGSINNWFSVYYKQVPAGTFSLYQADNSGRNMYGVVVTAVAPPPPQDLQASSMNGRVVLNWSPAAGATNYVVRRSDTSGGPYADIGSTGTTSYTDSTVVNGQTYYYVVAAEGYFATGSNSGEVVGAPRLAPDNLVAVGGTNQISLSWDPMTGAASYTVKRTDVSGGPLTNIATDVSTTTYVDSGLPDGQRFYYTVSATLTAGGESANADEATAVTVPSLPANFMAERFAATVIRLTWDLTDPVNPTTVVEKSSDGTTFSEIAAIGGGGRRYLDVGLAPLVTNYYRIHATNSAGSSVYSLVASADTPASGINVNFAAIAFTNSSLFPIPGYLEDYGDVFADRGNGYSYGWDYDNTGTARYRNAGNSPDERYDTFMHLQKPDPAGHMWEIGIANGLYLVHIISGDPTATDSIFQWDLEGWVSDAKTPNNPNYWQEFYLTTKVLDGRLTFNNGPAASNNKINFVDIYPATPEPNLLGLQPVSQTVTQNQSVTFSVTVAGGPEPYHYQWYGPSGLIYGAESSSYTIQFPQLADQGNYSVVVTNAGAGIQSSNATLTVIPDTWAPVAVSAGSVDGYTIGVAFDEAVDFNTALLADNYRVNGQQSSVYYVVQRDDRTVQLSVVTPVTADFQVTVSGISDLAGNTMASTVLNGVYMDLAPLDIGFPGALGDSFTADGDHLQIAGGGADIWGTADQCHFAYKMQSGDFDARVRVESLTHANDWSKAGIMARENTLGGDRNVLINTTPLPLNNVYHTQWREMANGDSSSTPTITPVSYPDAWIRMVREGDAFSTFIKTNGVDWVWTYTYTPSNSYPSDLFLGLAVTAHDNALTATGMFSSFTVSTTLATDVAMFIAPDAGVVAPGGAVTYTLEVLNQGATARAVVVTDPLPAGVAYTGSSTTNGTAAFSAGTVTWTVGDLAPGASGWLTITATADTIGTTVNTATAVSSGTDENPANNSASATVEVSGGLVIGEPTYNNGVFSFSLPTASGVNYSVQYKDNLSDPDWLILTNIPGNGLTIPVSDPSPNPEKRFYRTEVLPAR